MRFAEFFQEDNGSASSMRMFSFVALIIAGGISWYSVIRDKDSLDMIIVWVVAAFVPKAIQKWVEVGPKRKSVSKDDE